ncbi:MAG: DUF111 family protein, partial [Myxococcales bacterium]|nr:DUF111 family protein [Myxococcales bacterium]
TKYGSIRIKIGFGPDGEVWNIAPEYDDCARAARETGVPLKKVRQHALEVWEKRTTSRD